jgi:hypothetical protein
MQHPEPEEVAAFLAQHSGGTPSDLEPLTGGAWSSAWAYLAGEEELVIRFGRERSWYEADRMAMAFSRPDLPVVEHMDLEPGTSHRHRQAPRRNSRTRSPALDRRLSHVSSLILDSAESWPADYHRTSPKLSTQQRRDTAIDPLLMAPLMARGLLSPGRFRC